MGTRYEKRKYKQSDFSEGGRITQVNMEQINELKTIGTGLLQVQKKTIEWRGGDK